MGSRTSDILYLDYYYHKTTSASRRLNILCIKLKYFAFLQQCSSTTYRWWLVFYLHIENTYTTHHFRGDIWLYKSSLNPPLVIDVPVPNQEWERLHVLRVGQVLILPLFSMILPLYFWTVMTECVFILLYIINIIQIIT